MFFLYSGVEIGVTYHLPPFRNLSNVILIIMTALDSMDQHRGGQSVLPPAFLEVWPMKIRLTVQGLERGKLWKPMPSPFFH